jgi:hypothetical protein
MHAQFSNYFQGILNKFSLSIHPKKKVLQKKEENLSVGGEAKEEKDIKAEKTRI